MKQSPPKAPPSLRVGLISLGCAKNLVDAEIMLGSLMQQGVEITNDATQADALIVNTCSFIDSAQEESVDAILESSQVRDSRRPEQALIVAGCLSQRFRDELPTLLPEVDAFMGIDQVAHVGEVIRKAVAHRSQKLAAGPKGSGARARGRKQIVERMAALERQRPVGAKPTHDHSHDHDHAAKHRHGHEPGPKPVASPAPAVEVDVHLRPNYIPDYATPRFRLTPKHFAYVKIAEGCNHPCSFCIIPRMRGSHRSRAQHDIVTEAKQLLAEGVRELNLISQDSTYYGLDLRPNHSRAISSPERFRAAASSLPADATTLCTLLRALNELPGQFWIRLLYTHPAHWTDELIRTIAECPKVARYIDMPLQHIHANMLERMRRETSREFIEDLILRLRAGLPGITLRTTFIVGFPGETEASFESLLAFVRSTRFERLGVFTYSKEDGTRAAGMGGHITDRVKQRRRERLMAAQLEVARSVSTGFVGRTLTALVEGNAQEQQLRQANVLSWEHGLMRDASGVEQPALPKNYMVARGEADAPDIDGRIYVRGRCPAGEFARVKVVGHTDYDLIGVVEDAPR